MTTELKCARCGVQACREDPATKPKYPKFCPVPQQDEVLASARAVYRDDPEINALAAAAARVESQGYGHWPRVQEVMAFARQLGTTRLGIATCIGLIREARLLTEILEANGFEVFSVCCKAGAMPKEDLGLQQSDKLRPEQYEAACSPVAQAELLAAADTGLNIAVGLCVGHDSLFFQHSKVPVTVLVAKDRVTGHNPVAALYTSRSYYRHLRGEQTPRKKDVS